MKLYASIANLYKKYRNGKPAAKFTKIKAKKN